MVMVNKIMTVERRLPMAAGAAALMLCLAVSGGCASSAANGSSSGTSSKAAFGKYDRDNDSWVTPEEWDLAYQAMDANGDGIVSYDEYATATLATQD